jgi:hypothetical protein
MMLPFYNVLLKFELRERDFVFRTSGCVEGFYLGWQGHL